MKFALKVTIASLFVAASAVLSNPASAQDDDVSSGTSSARELDIKPYDGPPIFLEETEQPKPVRVSGPTVNKETYEDGTTKVERSVIKYSDNSYVADGPTREFYPDGKPFMEGEFREGKRVGEWTYWHNNGQKNRTMTYYDGALDGSWEVFREDGTLLMTESFRKGKRDGKWLRYDDTGKQVLREEFYKNGIADGEWHVWFPSGKLRQQVQLKDGKRHGTTIEWDEEGNKITEINFADDKLHGVSTRWMKDGKKSEQAFENGKLIPKGEKSSDE